MTSKKKKKWFDNRKRYETRIYFLVHMLCLKRISKIISSDKMTIAVSKTVTILLI